MLSPPRCVSPLVDFHFHYTVADFENRDVERAAAEIINRDRLVLLPIEAVGQRRCGGLIDDAHHFEARHLTGVLRGLALSVVEIRRYRDDGFRHFLAQVRFGRFLQLAEHHRRNLRRGILLAVDVHARVVAVARDHLIRHQLHFLAHFVEAASHEALDRIDGVFRIRDGLALGHLAHQPLPVLGEAHHRRRCATALLVRDDHRRTRFHDGYHRIRGAQVDSNDFTHDVIGSSCVPLLVISRGTNLA